MSSSTQSMSNALASRGITIASQAGLSAGVVPRTAAAQAAWCSGFDRIMTAARRCWSYSAAQIATWYARASSRRELSLLHDHDLADIRISGADARAEARKPFWCA